MIDTSQLEDGARPEAIELRDALIEYKKSSGRMFPTCSEVLEVIRGLGYAQMVEAEEMPEIEEAPALTTEIANELDAEPAVV